MKTAPELHMPLRQVETLVTRMVYPFARMWSVAAEDCRQEAWCAVLDAAKRYDPTKGDPAALYATAIARAVRRLWLCQSADVRPPTHRDSEASEVKKQLKVIAEPAAYSGTEEEDEDGLRRWDAERSCGAVLHDELVANADWAAQVRELLGDYLDDLPKALERADCERLPKNKVFRRACDSARQDKRLLALLDEVG